jgi:hypothetical protein
MIITLCSSVDFTPKLIEIKKYLESKGHKVYIPYFTQKILDGKISYEEFMHSKSLGGDISFREAESIDFFERYWNFIKQSDAILVVNLHKKGIDGYIGGNTLMEMGFAYGFKKKIFLFNPIPKRSERIHYVDEIIDLKPIIIDGELDKIV